MAVNNPSLLFPAWMHDHRWAWKLEDDSLLRLATKDYLRRNDRRTERVLDSALNLYAVSGTRVMGRAGIFGWRPGFKGTYLRVETLLTLERKLSFDEAKKYVIDFISLHPGAYQSGVPIDELGASILSAGNWEEVLSAL